MEDFSLSDWLVWTAYTLLAAIGGALGYVMRAHDDGEVLSWVRGLFEALGSGFIGILVILLCNALQFSTPWTGFVVGVFGWLGSRATIGVLQRIATDRFGNIFGAKRKDDL